MGFTDVKVKLGCARTSASAPTSCGTAPSANWRWPPRTRGGGRGTARRGRVLWPKLEFHLTDAIGAAGNAHLQLDFNMPERLNAEFVDADGQRKRPVMLHRAIFGSMERFIGILIENYAGRLPGWLAPVQVVVTTITSDADHYAGEVAQHLKSAGLRVEIDLRNEKINYKIREHSLARFRSSRWSESARRGAHCGTSDTRCGKQEFLPSTVRSSISILLCHRHLDRVEKRH